MDFETFAYMGGYALNVWGSYGIAIAGYGAILVWSLIKLEKLRKQDTKK